MSTQIQRQLNPQTMKWLLRREFWEYKGSMFWAPLIVGALLVILIGGTVGYGVAAHGMPLHVTLNGELIGREALGDSIPLASKIMMGKVASGMYLVSSAPLFLLLAFAVFAYCLGALYDERRDRSILFWKSLPVSDAMTVLSKVLTAAVVAPLITIVLATAASLAQLLLACTALAFNGINLFGAILGSANLYLSPLILVALLPVYMVWALPTIGWLMLVSSWARSKPFLWAVGVPVVTLMVVKWVSVAMEKISGEPLGLFAYVWDVVVRMLGGVVPGIWLTFDRSVMPALRPTGDGIELGSVVSASWMTLTSPQAWIGVVAGVAMLFVAMRLRRRRDEG
jgi:ABC-2 type transport system permease protein